MSGMLDMSECFCLTEYMSVVAFFVQTTCRKPGGAMQCELN